MEINNLKKANGYLNIASRANYVIWGSDNLNGYTHKLYLIVYREDFGKTIEKTLKTLECSGAKNIKLSVCEFNIFAGTDKAKLLAIKNKGISEQIINLLRGEDG